MTSHIKPRSPIRDQAVGLAAGFLALLVPGTSFGRIQVEPRSTVMESAYEKCSGTGDAAQGVMPAIFDCQRAELDRVDGALNRTYQQLRRRLPAARFRKLQIEERVWLRRLDPLCQKEAARENGGTMGQDWQLFWLGCLIRETGAGLSVLEALLPKGTSK